MTHNQRTFGTDDFSLETWLAGAGISLADPTRVPSIDYHSQMPVLSLDSGGWTRLTLQRSDSAVVYIHGDTETIDGEQFSVVSVYDKETMKLRQKILTRSDLLKG